MARCNPCNNATSTDYKDAIIEASRLARHLDERVVPPFKYDLKNLEPYGFALADLTSLMSHTDEQLQVIEQELVKCKIDVQGLAFIRPIFDMVRVFDEAYKRGRLVSIAGSANHVLMARYNVCYYDTVIRKWFRASGLAHKCKTNATKETVENKEIREAKELNEEKKTSDLASYYICMLFSVLFAFYAMCAIH
jgi:hypothetical protein